MTFEAIVHAGMVLIPPEVDLPDGTIVRVEPQQPGAHARQQRLEELRREIALGMDDIQRGDYTECDEDELKQVFERIKAEGRSRIATRPPP